jgi:arylsulfatase A-like enzyme
MIFYAPGWMPVGHRESRQVGNLDVAPSLLDIAGVGPLPKAAGVSLLRAYESRPLLIQRPAFTASTLAERATRHAKIRAVAGDPTRPAADGKPALGVRSAEWKYFQGPYGDELYNLVQDAAETRNLSGEHPEITRRMASLAVILATLYPARPSASEPVNSELVNQLRALGYVQ